MDLCPSRAEQASAPATSTVAVPLSIPSEPSIGASPDTQVATDPLPSRSKVARPDEEIFFVDKILKKRVNNKGEILYYVKWKNYDSKHNTWEPATSFNDVALIENWEAKRKRGKKMKRGGKTRKLAKPVSDSSSVPSDSCSVSTRTSFNDHEPSESSCDIIMKTKPSKKAKVKRVPVPRQERAGGLSPEASTSASTSIAGSVLDGKKKKQIGLLERGFKKVEKKLGLKKIKEGEGESQPEAGKVSTPVKTEGPLKLSKMDFLLSQKKLTPEKVPKKKKKKTGIIRKKLELGSPKTKLKTGEKEVRKKFNADRTSKDVPVRDTVMSEFTELASRDFALKYLQKGDPSIMVEMTIIKDGDKEILFEEIRFGTGSVRRSEPLGK
ncbi:hypothetical protein RvY_17714 [Ramazzottius varieornatus]|uniref:Chromo domain-containing protein n=1 Tax=Ramazzottius varieornatus TaxID=947166 RepID=A0A1D1W330_RAMVA|nr:hypothetical protein RvY_17714 [Ramazzottius varieornatus]